MRAPLAPLRFNPERNTSMTAQSLIAESADLIPFADLYLSPLNPRRIVSEPGLEALA